MKQIALFALLGMFLTSCQESLEEQAARAQREFTEKNCPMQLTSTIILDSCSFEAESHTMCYYYQLLGEMDNDGNLNTRMMRQMLVERLKNELSMRVFKEAGYNFRYQYYSQRHPGQILFETTITKKDY